MLGLSDGAWFVLLGGICLAIGIRNAIAGRKSRAWREVDGEIVSSEVVKSGWKFDPRWDVAIRYRYAVDGVQYDGERVALTSVGTGELRWPAASRARKCPAGARVKVYVSPGDPAMAVLEREGPPFLMGEVIVGAAVAAYGIYELVT